MYDPILCMNVPDTVKTNDANTIDKAIRACDRLSDLQGSDPVGNGYVKNTGSEFIVLDAHGNVKGRYTTQEEADEAARKI